MAAAPVTFRTETQVVGHLEARFAERFASARPLLEASGHASVRAYLLDHPAFGDPVLMLRFVPKAGDEAAQSNALLQALVPWLGGTPFGFVAVDVAGGPDEVLPLRAFRWGYWRVDAGTWLALGDDPYAYFEARAQDPAPARTAMRVQALLRMGLVDRARDFPARSRRLLRQALDEVTQAAAQDGGLAALEVQVLEALLGDAVANRDDRALTAAEVDAWSARLLSRARALELTLGDGPLFVLAPRYRQCSGTRHARWTVLADGRVADVRVDVDAQGNGGHSACSREFAEALAQWRFVPPALLGVQAPVQRSESFATGLPLSQRSQFRRTSALMQGIRAATNPRSAPGR